MRASPVSVPRTAVLLFAGLFAVYLVNARLLGAADSLPTRVVPFSIVREGNVDLDEFTWERQPNGRLQYYLRKRGEHIYSGSTMVTPVLISPLYLLPAWWLAAHRVSYDDVRARVIIVVMERCSAALLSALSASVLFVVLCRLTTRRWALALALTYALGTSTWSISSQALWSHAFGELALVLLCALLLVREPSRTALLAAGIIAFAAVANRPPMIGFALLAFAFVWVHHRRHVLAFAALPALAAVALVVVNLVLFRRLAGSYGVDLGQFSGSWPEGMAGLLLSPNRGLFIFTPIMLFAFWGGVRVWRVDAHPWLRFLTLGIVLHLLLYGKFSEWWGGYTYGPRYMTDVLPALTLLLVYGLVPLCRSRSMRILAAALAFYGIAVQAVGAYCDDDGWNWEPARLDRQPWRVWDWSDLQIVRALRSGWHGTELVSVMFDAFRAPVPAKLVPLSPGDLASEFHVAEQSLQLARNSTRTLDVRVTNRAQRAWPAFSGEGRRFSSRYLTFLVVRWFAGGQPVRGLGDVVAIPANLAPGETADMSLSLTAPPQPGGYELEIRVTQAIDGTRGVGSPNALRLPVRVE